MPRILGLGGAREIDAGPSKDTEYLLRGMTQLADLIAGISNQLDLQIRMACGAETHVAVKKRIRAYQAAVEEERAKAEAEAEAEPEVVEADALTPGMVSVAQPGGPDPVE